MKSDRLVRIAWMAAGLPGLGCLIVFGVRAAFQPVAPHVAAPAGTLAAWWFVAVPVTWKRRDAQAPEVFKHGVYKHGAHKHGLMNMGRINREGMDEC